MSSLLKQYKKALSSKKITVGNLDNIKNNIYGQKDYSNERVNVEQYKVPLEYREIKDKKSLMYHLQILDKAIAQLHSVGV
jgi:hypothetical protein